MMGVFFTHIRVFATLLIFSTFFETCFVLCETETQAKANDEEKQDRKNSEDRSWTEETSKVEFSVFKTRDRDAPFEVDLQIFGEKRHLRLHRPESSIFAAGFKVNGREMRSDELENVERDIFVDNESKAVIQVLENSDATYCLRGWINGTGIIARENCEMEAIQIRKKENGRYAQWCGVGSHRRRKPGQNQNPAPQKLAGSQSQKPQNPNSSRRKNSQDSQKPPAQNPQTQYKPKSKPNPSLSLSISSVKDQELRKKNNKKMGYVEVMMLFDKEGSGDIAKNNFTIVQYAAILAKAVNVIYSSLSDPKLQVLVAGARSLTDDEDQTVVKDVGSKIHQMLKKLTTLVKDDRDLDEEDQTLEPSDVVALMSGRDTLSEEGKSGTAGLANKRQACTSAGNAVARDTGAAFEGVITLAHEMGHTLGCEHDFDVKPKRAECFPKERDRRSYVMGYGGKTPNTYEFSPCSKDTIKAYTKGKGKCVFQKAAPEPISQDNVNFPGNVTTVTQQCIAALNKYTGGGDVAKDYPEDYVEDCLKIKCTYTESKTGKDRSLNYKATEGTKCLSSVVAGVCQNQQCSSSGDPAEKSINRQCADKVKKVKNGAYSSLKTKDEYVTCAKSSYACRMKKKDDGTKAKLDITPLDGTPCVYQKVYGSCTAGRCECKPQCYQ